VGAEELRQWIQAGRANAQSRIQPEGGAEWRPLASFPEFADALAAQPLAPPPLSSPMLVRDSPARKTNGMAIAGLVFGLLGIPCCVMGLGSLLGLLFSVIGLVQIGRNPGQEGKGVAIIGIIVSLAGLLFFVAFWALALTGFVQGLDQ